MGGTWYWNRYPGARCDSESVIYSFSDHLSEELLQEWSWSERYAGQPEILRYLNHAADRMELRRDIQCNTRVTAAAFDESRNRWQITTDQGDQVSATYLITAVGCLSSTNMPEIKGLESFEGTWHHTGRWPHDGVDFTGQRVAVIGTGATSVQVVPEVASQAAQVYVFQRTPNYDIPGVNFPLTAEYLDEVKAGYKEMWQTARQSPFGFYYGGGAQSAMDVGPEERRRIYEEAWQKGGFRLGLAFNDLLFNQESNDTASEFVRSKIRATVKDADVAELLVPKDHPFFTRRPPLEHGYYEAFNRDNVTLVDVRRAPIEEITPKGVRTGGVEYEVDSIIFATGFDAMTGTLNRIDIRGRGGVALKETWAEGPSTYLGLATHGFPNMFMITGPQSPSVLTNMPVAIEQHGDWIADCLAYLRDHNVESIEPLQAAQQQWVAHAGELADSTLIPQTNSWWVGANIPGKPRLLYPYVGGLDAYRARCDEVATNGYEGFTLEKQTVTA